MRVLIVSFIGVIGLLSSTLPALAQVGPCGAGDSCAVVGQICRGAVGSRFCFIPCISTDVFGASAECPTTQSCLPPSGTGYDREVCVDLTGAVPVGGIGSIDTATTCNDARPCPSGRSCVSGTCRQPMGGRCTTSADCNTGTTCVGDRISGMTCSGVPDSAAAAEAPAEVPFTPITPNLGVPIPGAESLTAPTREGGVVVVSFLAQYINSVYRYLTGIILVIAIVMVVYGGFLYLVGSAGVGSIQRGKQIITDAIMGMVITLAAFAILNTVNPATTNLKVLNIPFVETDVWASGEADVDFGTAVGMGPAHEPGVPYAPTELASLDMCGQLRQYLDNGTIVLQQAQDREGILGGTGFIQRPSGSEWCQLLSRSSDPSCPSLPTRAQFDAITTGRAATFDDSADGVPIHPMICRYLLDLAIAKTNGTISGTVSAKIVGRHHRCANGAWFFRSAESNNNCSTLAHGREECMACVRSVLSGGDDGQSSHWTGQAFDMVNNESVQRYTVNVLAPRYKEENGGRAVFDDVFGGNVEPHEGTISCSTRTGRIRTGAYCVDGNCGTPDRMVGVGLDAVCGHYSGGTNSHIHVSFY
ncbi:hypothetical protein K8R04_02485 [Candidatus Uhrbacteria bacterium]|nr:hypothetical protein [Candidatus Uhrbacteria bacterium]